MYRILQLTDLHLFADPARRLRGVLPEQTLRDVLDHLAESEDEFSAVVLTGDLAHDELAETYGIVSELTAALRHPLLIIPSSFLFGGLLVGANSMQRAVQVPQALIVALNGLIVVFVVAAARWRESRAARVDVPETDEDVAAADLKLPEPATEGARPDE